MRILIVEDEQHLAEGLCFNLEVENFDVEIAADGARALRLLLEEKEKFDAIILDVMLPEVDGFTVAKTLREAKDYTPILMLTARGRPEDVLEGFAAAPTIICLNLSSCRFFWRAYAGLLRRQRMVQQRKAIVGPETLLPSTAKRSISRICEIQSDDEMIHLTLMEAKLLRYLIENEGTPVSRKTILEDIWDLHEDTDTRAIDNFIVRLRTLSRRRAEQSQDRPDRPRHRLPICK